MRILAAVLTVVSLPLTGLAAAVTLAGDAVAALVARRGRTGEHRQLPPPRDTTRASIVILNWNGRDLLAQGLPSVLAAVARAGGDHEVIVVDNGSDDGSTDWVRATFPTVRVIALEQNVGFGPGNNIGVQAAQNDIVVLLNNDMVVDESFLLPLLRPFADDRVFAVSAQIRMKDPSRSHLETGLTRAALPQGLLQVWHDPVTADAVMPCLWAGGGSAAYDKRRFLELGGFHPLYAPFYVEDVDLSYRAWKRGWSVLLAPQSIVYHCHRASTSRLGTDYVEQTLTRNLRLFTWHNITHPLWTVLSLLRLPYDTLLAAPRERQALLWAWRDLPRAVWCRWQERLHSSPVLSDRAILTLARSPYEYKERFLPPPRPTNGRRRILFLCPYLPVPPTHGGAVRMLNLIKHLARNNDVDVLSFMDSEAEEAFLPQLEPYCRRLRAIVRRPRLARRNPLRDRSIYVEEFDTPDMRAALAQMLAEEDYHVLQIEYMQMAQYHPGGRRALTVLDEVDIFFRSFHRMYIGNRPRPRGQDIVDWLRLMRYELQSCQRFAYVLAMSSTDAAFLADHLPMPSDRIVPIDNGVDTDYYRPSSAWPGGSDLLFMGSYRHTPNREGMGFFLRDVFPLIRHEVPAARLYIVGDGDWQQDIEGHDGVIATGFVEDTRPYMARCAVSVVPILSGAGTRIKILESLAAGLPIVSTTIGCEGIAAQHGRDVLIADDAKGFAEAVVRILRNSALAEELRRNGRSLAVARYDWRAIVARLEDLYERGARHE